MSQPEGYPTPLGKLQHLLKCTRPDVAKAVSAFGSFHDRPTKQHWEAAQRVLSYISGERTVGITYGISPMLFEGFTDFDFAMMPGARSTTSMISSMHRKPVSWQSKLQPAPTGSTSKAEYKATHAGGRKALWLQKVIRDFVGLLLALWSFSVITPLPLPL